MQDFRERMAAIVEQLAPVSRAGAKQQLERLWQHGVETYDDLLALATSEQEEGDLRGLACWHLARLGDDRALAPLVHCLHAEDVDLRRQAARCLGILDGDEAGARLVECLEQEQDPDVRMYAAHSLGMIGGLRAFEALRSILHHSHEEPRVRAMAIESLAHLEGTQAADLVGFLEDPSAEVRYWTVFALGQLGDASVIPMLQRLSGDRECPEGLGSIADEVVEAIENIGSSTRHQ